MLSIYYYINEPHQHIIGFTTYEIRIGSDQPVHPSSLMKAYAIRTLCNVLAFKIDSIMNRHRAWSADYFFFTYDAQRMKKSLYNLQTT